MLNLFSFYIPSRAQPPHVFVKPSAQHAFVSIRDAHDTNGSSKIWKLGEVFSILLFPFSEMYCLLKVSNDLLNQIDDLPGRGRGSHSSYK